MADFKETSITIFNDQPSQWRWSITHDGFTFASDGKLSSGSAIFPDEYTAGKSALEHARHYMNRPRDQKEAFKARQQEAEE